MPWMSCEAHGDILHEEVKRLWDRLQHLADTVGDLREENARGVGKAGGGDRQPEGRGQQDGAMATWDHVTERMTRMERMMERVLYACSVIEEKIDRGPR